MEIVILSAFKEIRLTYRVISVIMAYTMIQSYKDKRTTLFAQGERVKEFQAFSRQLEKRLEILDAAPTKESLMALPSNHFESLAGDRKGQCSIRVNQRWRICFAWPEGAAGPSNVEIVDYH